ncbi:MAG: nucleotide sugar dehydrogenase, partial [Chlamydiae bacterium]|nr:nucleotide sugar dehydrogenase [Chlamydiota bacterium]
AEIFHADHLSIYDVLKAAQTKWNFLPFTPGLVGGHCIGVDPYYLAAYAKKNRTNPRMILAGRHINDRMSTFLAQLCHQALPKKRNSILIFGLAFKENIPDLRNTKVVPLIQQLKALGHEVDVVDPVVDAQEAVATYGLTLKSLEELPKNNYDCLIGAVSHAPFTTLTPAFLSSLGKNAYYLFDIKNMWARLELPAHCHKISL